jgi:hypothetical protein
MDENYDQITCKSQDSVGEFGTVIWVGKQSKNRDFRQGTARRIIRISPPESWDLQRSMTCLSTVLECIAGCICQGSKQYSSITKKTLVLHERKHMATPPCLDQESRPQRHPEQFHTPSPSALSLLTIRPDLLGKSPRIYS